MIASMSGLRLGCRDVVDLPSNPNMNTTIAAARDGYLRQIRTFERRVTCGPSGRKVHVL